MEAKIAHLGFVQSAVTRMASNSFTLKSWTVTIISALLALAASVKNRSFVEVGFLPAVVFWVMDSYYLQLERMFRKLYDVVAGTDPSKVTFSLDPSPYKSHVSGILRLMFTKSEWPIYVPMLAALGIAVRLVKP